MADKEQALNGPLNHPPPQQESRLEIGVQSGLVWIVVGGKPSIGLLPRDARVIANLILTGATQAEASGETPNG